MRSLCALLNQTGVKFPNSRNGGVINTAERIYEKVKTLPESTVREIMDFIEFLESKQRQTGKKTDGQIDVWLSKMWGCSPDFPERLPDLPPESVEEL
jgi:hypothetical protein